MLVDLAERRGARFGDGGRPDQRQLGAVLWALASGLTGDKPSSLLAVKIRERAKREDDLPLSTLWDLLDQHKTRLVRSAREEDIAERAATVRRGFKTTQPGVDRDLDLLARHGESREEVLRDASLYVAAEATSRDGLVAQVRRLIRQEIHGRRSGHRGEAIELARFAERESVLKAGRDAGLPPREYQLFTFFVENPSATNAKVAQALGVAVGTIKSMRNRIKNTPGIG